MRLLAALLTAIALGAPLIGCYPVAQKPNSATGVVNEYGRLNEAELQTKAQGSDPRAMRELAFRAMEGNQSDLALQWVNRSLEVDPKSSDAYNLLGMVHSEKGQSRLAESAYRHAAELAPAKGGPLINLGRLYVGQKRYQAAAETFEQALQRNPQNVDAALLAGDAWRLFGSSINAKRYYRKALDVDAKEPRALKGLGIVLTNTGQFEEAHRSLTQARELGDDSSHTLGYIGLTEALGARTAAEGEAALKNLEAAKTAGEDESHIWYGLGLAHVARADYRKAIATLREGIGRYPEVSGLHHTLGEAYALTGRTADSAKERTLSADLVRTREKEERFLQNISSHPEEVGPRLSYLQWLIGRKEWGRAIGPCLDGLRMHHGDPQLRATLKKIATATKQPALLSYLEPE